MPRETRLRTDPLRPRSDRFPDDAPGFSQAMAAHDRAVASGQGGYLDPGTGLFVMTASGLAARISCCDTGCRHCPFEV